MIPIADSVFYKDGIPFKAVDNGDGTFLLPVDAHVSATIGDLLIVDGGGIERFTEENPGIVAVLGEIEYSHTTHAVTDTDSEALGSNISRKYLLITNLGNDPVFLAVGTVAVVSQGILLSEKGSSFEMSIPKGNLSTKKINAITSGTSATLLIAEGE